MKARRTGREKGQHLRPRLIQKIAEGKTSYGLSWEVAVMVNIKKTLAPPQRRDGARRLFAGQADIACTQREAS